MSFHDLSPREQHHLNRAYSQAVYLAHRGLFDSLRIHAPSLTPQQRNQVTTIVSEFLNAYVIPEIGQVIHPPSDGLTRIAEPDLEPITPVDIPL
ncbi:MAG: hypothetical protein EKK55_21875 [Rhodocyclaceae bacterium]|nr:MAG: hypothetical protein EKK55_21875 [Rhodocyclaceae bacterium]